MAKIKFREVKLSKDNKLRLQTINRIIQEYQRQGYVLTLRQLYYQLVSRDIIPNKVSEYAKLSTLLKEGRMGGIVDWAAIEDRLRKPYTPASFDSPKDIMTAAMQQYQLPRMEGQAQYVEVWVEKDALSGVLKRVTSKYHVPILVNRGYSSASSMFDSYERFREPMKNGRKCTILYLGDFDPSGVDMIRDVRDRTLEFLLNDENLVRWIGIEIDKKEDDEREEVMEELSDNYNDYGAFPFLFNKEDDEDDIDFNFAKAMIFHKFEVMPVALTMQQIKQYKPPPNPAKKTDPRAKDFIKEHGATSWEVDALRPEVLNTILEMAIAERIDMDMYKNIVDREQADKDKLQEIIDMNYPADDTEEEDED